MTVDCRYCKYFVPIWQFDEKGRRELRLRLQAQDVYREKNSKSIKGYCTKKGIVILYYKGRCRDFTPQPRKHRQLPLFGREP